MFLECTKQSKEIMSQKFYFELNKVTEFRIFMPRLLITLTVFLIGCGMTKQKNTMTTAELLSKERNQYIATFQLGDDKHKTAKPMLLCYYCAIAL